MQADSSLLKRTAPLHWWIGGLIGLLALTAAIWLGYSAFWRKSVLGNAEAARAIATEALRHHHIQLFDNSRAVFDSPTSQWYVYGLGESDSGEMVRIHLLIGVSGNEEKLIWKLAIVEIDGQPHFDREGKQWESSPGKSVAESPSVAQ